MAEGHSTIRAPPAEGVRSWRSHMVKAGTRVTRRHSRSVTTACCTALVIVAAVSTAFRATGAQVSLPTGQNIAPAYEGWEQNPDGSYNLVFGYFNRNWEEEIDLPIGPDNNLAPGEADQ